MVVWVTVSWSYSEGIKGFKKGVPCLQLEKGANPNVSFSYTERKVTPVIYAAM